MPQEQGLNLPSVMNFRDLGGYKSGNGCRVRRGLIFRSGDSTRLTDSDSDKMREYGFKLIVDLRGDTERDVYPSRWPLGADAELIEANIFVDINASMQSLIDIIREDPTPAGADRMMRTTYSMFPVSIADVLGQIGKRLASGNSTPTLVHCAFGRDRTGFVCAMLLHALGVSREDIVMDYLKTNEYLEPSVLGVVTHTVLLEKAGIDLEERALRILFQARLENFLSAFKAIDAVFGSPDQYLCAIGIDEAVQARLREYLLEPA